MKKTFILIAGLCITLTAYAQQKNYTRLVNVFIGTGGHGHTYPGVTAPFGMVQLSPDTRMEGWDACGGYYYTDTAIYGFSHTHLSGTGIRDYGDILLMPTTGSYQWKQDEYKSSFSHKNEHASPGYYQVYLNKYHINVQLTATERAGMHQYTFPASAGEGNILLDLHHGLGDRVLNSWLRIINDTTIIGLRQSAGWAHDQILYFALKFSRPFQQDELALNNEPVNNKDSLSGENVKAYFTFNTEKEKKVFVKVGLSAVSPEGAMENLNTEMPGFDFNRIRNQEHEQWNKMLSEIEVKGGTKDEQIMFYTALYHCLITPNIYQDVDGKFRSTDLKVHQAHGFTNYTVFSLWDTYRAFNPLMTILQPKRVNDWINTFLAEYKYGGMTPTWELSGNETHTMIGHHSVPVMVDAYQKGIRGYDAEDALASMENYDESDRYGLPKYREQGYLGEHDISESVSRTLEYSYDDWCIAQMAKMLGRVVDYKKYIQRAQFYKNIYDPSTGFFRGKVNDTWFTPFDPTEVNHFYTEANAWQYNFAAQQDVSGMIRLQGGRQKFADKLDTFFTMSSKMTGDVPPDISGMIGQYAHGDEPSHHIAYLYDYAGMPWKTQQLVHQICTTLYFDDPNGESGNDDCGQMSAWLVMSDMGFYQVCPGRPEYAFGTPLFDQVKVHLSNGNTFTINAKNISGSNFYIQSVQLNWKKYSRSYITHDDILRGATLTFTMGSSPDKHFATQDADCPHSSITHDLITPAPFVKPANSQAGSIRVGDVDHRAVIYYTTNGSMPGVYSKRYTGKISLDNVSALKMIAIDPERINSKVVSMDDNELTKTSK
ncbi:MAG: glycoside hydrolase family 92 protein [Chitinophagaceae bacterium]|nr:MAG: glycoside hydrolase family 92 protein [Chitinophagaceae bacterium]